MTDWPASGRLRPRGLALRPRPESPLRSRCLVQGGPSRPHRPETGGAAAPERDEVRRRATVGRDPARAVAVEDDPVAGDEPHPAVLEPTPDVVHVVARVRLPGPRPPVPVEDRPRRSGGPDVLRPG